MKRVQGDIIVLAQNGEFDVIMQGCNCFCRMGRGLAGQIRLAFPEAEAVDKTTKQGDRSKLGTCTYAACRIEGNKVIHVVNAYTQHHWDGNGTEVLADYAAIRSCLVWLRNNYSTLRIGLPKIGAGLARGDWPTILAIIEEVLASEDVTIVEYAQ